MKILESIVLSAGLLFGCAPPQSPVEGKKETSFVYAEGTDLKLDGRNFYFIGVNICGLANDSDIFVWRGAASHGKAPDDYVRSIFNTLRVHGLNAIRFCAFQSYTNGGTDFSSIDRIVRYAEENNIKLIPVLTNQWDYCPGDIYKYSSWYRQGYIEPQANETTSYREYVRRIVTRYKNSPAILMWQLMNEAESKTTEGKSDPEALYNFASDMSQFVRSIDPNHLVSLGTIGTGQPGTQNSNFGRLHSVKTIDIVEAHDYHNERIPWPDDPWNSVGAAHSASVVLEKPFFIGEAGIRAGCDNCPSREERVRLFRDKIDAAFSRGVDGYLLWKFEESEGTSRDFCDNDPLCFTEEDPLMELLTVFSPQTPRA